MNKKGLLEKKNSLLVKFNNLKAKSEKDSLSKEDVKVLSDIKDAIVPINKQLAEIEKNSNGIKDDVKKGNKSMNIEERKELATSVFADMVRGKKDSEAIKKYKDTVELTTPNATVPAGGDTKGLIPTEIVNNIIEQLGSVSPAYQLATKVPGTGYVRVPREDGLADAGFVGESDANATIPVNLKYVELRSKRFGGKTSVTNTMLNASAPSLANYVVNHLTRAAGHALDYAILVGANTKKSQLATNTFIPVIGNNDSTLRFTIDLSKVTIEDFMNIQNSLHPEYLKNAVWVVSRNAYNVITKLKDGDGSYFFTKSVTPRVVGASFLNSPVYVSDALDGAASEVVYGDFSFYDMLSIDGLRLVQISNDTSTFDTDTTYFGLNGHTDGAVANPYAFATAVLKPTLGK